MSGGMEDCAKELKKQEQIKIQEEATKAHYEIQDSYRKIGILVCLVFSEINKIKELEKRT